MQAYCVKCRTKKEMKHAKAIAQMAADIYKDGDKVEQREAESSYLLVYLSPLDLNSAHGIIM